MRQIYRTMTAGLALVLATATSGHAGLVGDNVTLGGFLSLQPSVGNVTVQAGAADQFTFDFGQPFFDVNIEDNSIIITALAAAVGTYGTTFFMDFLDLDFDGGPGGLTGVAVSSTGVTNMSNSNVTFTSNSLNFNFDNTSWAAGSSVTLELTSATQVPEPMTAALLGAGLLGLGLARRRRD